MPQLTFDLMEDLRRKWDWSAQRATINERCKQVWDQQPPEMRLPHELAKIYLKTESIISFDRQRFEPLTPDEAFGQALKYAPVALHLERESEQAEPNPLHHYMSARELVVRAGQTQKPWLEVQASMNTYVHTHQ